MDTQADFSRISLHKKLLLQETDSKVLKELNRANHVPTKIEGGMTKPM
jgi:hypothetical protein